MTAAVSKTGPTVLDVENLNLCFSTPNGPIYALSNVSFSVRKGEVLSLVGESGCGKSVTAMAIMGLLPFRTSHVTCDRLAMMDTDLGTASERTMRSIRGNRIGMIFQDPMTCLNPAHTIGMQIAETVRKHKKTTWKAAYRSAAEMLDLVRIPDAGRRLHAYPHQLSGGMRQRVMIAMALCCDPELLIADEPTTALDVTVQAQILNLLDELRKEKGMSVILITHDLGVVAQTADRVAVMYAGRIAEEGSVDAVFSRPSHGYTAGLLRSLPGLETGHRTALPEIAGTVPRLSGADPSCVFEPRCEFAIGACRTPLPPPTQIASSHRARCIRSDAVFEAVRNHEFVRAWAQG